MNSGAFSQPLTQPPQALVKKDKYTIDEWRVEDPVFWAKTGKKIALRNLAFSIFAEFLGFSVWQIWSVVAVNLSNIGFKFSINELFWLAALPGLTGATLRLPYAWMVPLMGGRNWTVISAALLLLPTVGIAIFIQRPDTPYWVFMVLACLCGFGGGNFASSMANINYFFPMRRKGLALGVNAAGGNIGVSVVQFAIPILILYAIFGSWGGEGQVYVNGDEQKIVYLQNAGLMWVPLIVAATLTSYFFMNNLNVKDSLMNQIRMFKNKHTWIMSYLYIGTFGSFIGYSAGFPLLIKSQFPDVNPLQYAFLGPLVGSLIRPVGGWLSDKVGGATVTFYTFIVMALTVFGVLYFLSIRTEPGAFVGFFLMFIILFVMAGIGNGSTYRMIPIIYITENNWKIGKDHKNEAEANAKAANQTTAVVGVTAAIGAYGAFMIPKSYGTSIAMTGGPQAAFIAFIAFYVGCICLTYWFYYRKNASVHC